VNADQRHRLTVRVTLVGSAVDLLLAVVKIVGGWFAGSQALIADGAHSLSDLATDITVIVASKHASRAADAGHPYGHGRIETLATVALALTMIAVAAGLSYDAIQRLMHAADLGTPGAYALLIAMLSVIAKEIIYRYTLRAAVRIDSDMLRANAWHSRTDALSSVVVILGVGGALLGYPFLDAVAAIFVALMIAHIGLRLGWGSVQELIDAGLSGEHLQEISRLIRDTEGVTNLHQLRTRSLGNSAMADVHIQVAPRLSVSEGHQISEAVRRRLIDEVGRITDVTVHTDPEDDLTAPDTAHLPTRTQVISDLTGAWGEAVTPLDLDTLQLHYLNGRIDVEVTLSLADGSALADLHEREARLQARAGHLSYLGCVAIKYQLAL
jgi:cation diffusion facilitator family transporter